MKLSPNMTMVNESVRKESNNILAGETFFNINKKKLLTLKDSVVRKS